MKNEVPDIETSLPIYAGRFVGPAGEYFLSVQNACVRRTIEEYAGGSLLDLGGGHGQLIALYDQLRFSYTVQGSDEICFKHALSDLPRRKTVVCNLRELPFDDVSIDVVVAIRLITHLEDWQPVIREMCRVAKRAVVIDFPTTGSLNGLSPLFFDLKKVIERDTRAYRNFSPADFRGQLESYNFKVDLVQKQFFIPMVVHRLLRGHKIAQASERFMRTLGITGLLGSPAVLRATRMTK